eukprot:4845697-Amphidinium_carterae.1
MPSSLPSRSPSGIGCSSAGFFLKMDAVEDWVAVTSSPLALSSLMCLPFPRAQKRRDRNAKVGKMRREKGKAKTHLYQGSH